MSVKVANSRFIDFSLRVGFYQQIFNNISSLQESGKQLVRTIEVAHSYRETNIVEELGKVLSHHPIKEYQLIGQYYLGWSAYRKGENAQTVFEKVVEASQTYRAKALSSLAAIESRKGNYEMELKYFIESLKYTTDLPTRIDLARGIAIVKAKEGYRTQALKDLENLMPSLRFAKPHTYYDYLNSLAVELGEVGRVEEAQNVCRITLASPFINAYPEWRETWQELALRGYKSRSVVSVPELPLKVKDNVVPMPANTNPIPIRKGRGKLFDLQKLRKKMVKEPNGENEDIKNMDEKDLFLKLMQLSTQDDITRKKLLKLVEYAIKVVSEPD